MAAKKAALGRGLSAILPPQEEAGEMSVVVSDRPQRQHLVGRVAEIDVAAIRPNPYQPRSTFDEDALEELAASIRELGVIQPITVREAEGGFEIISGERRWRAARQAGLRRVPAYVREADTEAMLEMAIVENIQREELNPLEVALGYQRLIDECGLTQEQVARKVGKGRATVTNFLRLLKLPPRIQASLRDGTVTVGHARALINVEDEVVQARLIDEIERLELSVREVEQRVRKWRESLEATPGRPDRSPHVLQPPGTDRESLQVREYESRLRSHLGTQVRIKHRGGSGQIEIEYYSDEDLERLLELILPL